MTLSAIPGEVEVGQPLTVRLEVVAEPGVTVSVDNYENALRENDTRFETCLLAVDRQVAVPTGEGTLRWSYEYRLEFVLPGEYELPAGSVTIVDERSSGDANVPADPDRAQREPKSLRTETLALVVRDSGAQPLSPEELTQINVLQPVELPRRITWWWAAAAVAVVVFAALLVARLRKVRRQQAERVVILPAHEWARQALAALIAEDLPASGRVQEFYYRISDIVRGYVERRFQVSAPEMTTEEFLTTASADRRFGETNTAELARFLQACDLVKYARQTPQADEAGRLVGAAGTFVERTRQRVGSGYGSAPVPAAIQEAAA